MKNKNNCLVCGSDLKYSNNSYKKKCYFCKTERDTNAECEKGHYICDSCHSSSAHEIIEKYCLNSNSQNPFEMANDLMMHPSVKMHGPEHHFLVPAVLITAYYNVSDRKFKLEEKLSEAKNRSKNVLGGFCGFYGSCGAAVGTGIYMSLITGATPLSQKEWGLCNIMTSNSLRSIGEHGGPRCCKRDTFLAIEEAVKFTKEELNVDMHRINIRCNFNHFNTQCLGEKCIFHNK